MILNEVINRLCKGQKVICYAAIVDRINLVFGPERINFSGKFDLYIISKNGIHVIDMKNTLVLTQEELDKWVVLKQASGSNSYFSDLSLEVEPTPYLLQQSFVREAIGVEVFELSRQL
jgi:hypothetical protein